MKISTNLGLAAMDWYRRVSKTKPLRHSAIQQHVQIDDYVLGWKIPFKPDRILVSQKNLEKKPIKKL